MIFAAVLAFLLQSANSQTAGYVEPAACAGCHRQLYESYRRTGMGRSFYAARPPAMLEDYARRNTYYQEASGEHFTMYTRDGRYYQRRHEIDANGREVNSLELEVHYVLGSGNHVRSYLHRKANGQLVELPIAWYTEQGGFWAMNPGYDRADHMEFGRKIDQECFFCHNAYPANPNSFSAGSKELLLPGAIPTGIDCERCHGPGGDHIEAANSGRSAETVRKAIVNPGRLGRDRQLEVCLQCHLESSSRPLPYSLRRYGRTFFSYRPGQPLADYMLHFDRSAPAREDGIEIAHSAYRLLQSACFRQSGTLTCVTCHNPHQESGREDYSKACLGCHYKQLDALVAGGKHPKAAECQVCHMPKRRTTDVSHVSMTDHYIQRRPATRDEPSRAADYRGEVVLLYPETLPAGAEHDLYLAVAQVADGANPGAGIPRLRKAIEMYRPERAEFYFELAEAYSKAGDHHASFAYYEQALRRQPSSVAARRGYATALGKAGRQAEAIEELRRAVAANPDEAAAANQLGEAYLQAGKLEAAVRTLKTALGTDPTLVEALVNLGAALYQEGDRAQALETLRTALLYRPNLAAAHSNLAGLLDDAGDFPQAEYHLRRAIRTDPSNAAPHYNYGRALSNRGRYGEARTELEAALRLYPEFAEAATGLGLVLARQGDAEGAIAAYRNAVRLRPGLVEAHYNLALALLAKAEDREAKQHLEAVLATAPNDLRAHFHLGNILLREKAYPSAVMHLRKASESKDPKLRAAAAEALRNLQLLSK